MLKLIFGLIFFGVLIFNVTGLDHLTLRNHWIYFVETFRDLGNLGLVCFFLVHTLLIVVCFPGTILFELSSGYLFGLSQGIFVVMAAKNVGGFLSFLLGSSLLKDWVHHKISSLPPSNSFHKIFSKIRDDPEVWKLALFLRLSPFPSWLNNYGLSISPLSLRDFLFANFFGSFPFIVQNVYFGSLVGSLDDLINKPNQSNWIFLIATLSFILLTRHLFNYLTSENLENIQKSENLENIQKSENLEKFENPEKFENIEKQKKEKQKKEINSINILKSFLQSLIIHIIIIYLIFS